MILFGSVAYNSTGNMKKTVGISILTSGNRLEYLKTCISSLLANCYYRPLCIAVLSNGSTDGTKEWLQSQKHSFGHGIELRYWIEPDDRGCAWGTNTVSEMLEYEYVLHLESDFQHIPEEMSHEDKFWLHRAVEFMDGGECDYLYLRRMVNEEDIRLHWWAKWMGQIDQTVDRYMRCPGFWWSNNPVLRNDRAIRRAGCLPLNTLIDGKKGTENWGKPELSTNFPEKPWIHKWGLFVHDVPLYGGIDKLMSYPGCSRFDRDFPGCKYGFFKDGRDGFCQRCTSSGIDDMGSHYERFRTGQ